MSTHPKGPRRARGLVGLFLLTYRNGELERQGEILSVDGDRCLVQFFSWPDSEPVDIAPLPIAFLYTRSVKLFPHHHACTTAVATYNAERERAHDIEIARQGREVRNDQHKAWT